MLHCKFVAQFDTLFLSSTNRVGSHFNMLYIFRFRSSYWFDPMRRNNYNHFTFDCTHFFGNIIDAKINQFLLHFVLSINIFPGSREWLQGSPFFFHCKTPNRKTTQQCRNDYTPFPDFSPPDKNMYTVEKFTSTVTASAVVEWVGEQSDQIGLLRSVGLPIPTKTSELLIIFLYQTQVVLVSDQTQIFHHNN